MIIEIDISPFCVYIDYTLSGMATEGICGTTKTCLINIRVLDP